MNGFNRVILAGNLSKDFSLRYSPSGTPVGNCSLAINRKFKKDGQMQDEVSFFDIVVIGKTAEACSQYLSKGSAILLEGRLRQNVWQDNDGKRHSKVEIIADNVQFLSKKEGAAPTENPEPGGQPDDDGPF